MKTCPSCKLRYPEETTFCFVDGATLEAAGAGLQGQTIAGLYVVDELLGQSPWSATHRADARLAVQRCTIKVTAEPIDEARRAAFVDAVKRSRRYAHPNLAPTIGGGVAADGRGYVVRPAVEARPLGDLIREARLAPDRAAAMAVQILRALTRVHDFGGAHGDLRPSNVLVTAADRVQLVDVGLGRTVLQEVWEASPQALASQWYLAPELSTQTPATVAGDLHALGVMAYEMLSQESPVEAASVQELQAELAGPLPEDLWSGLEDVPEAFRTWIETLLQRDSELRPPDAHLALEELSEVCEQAGLAVPAEASWPAAAEPPPLAVTFSRWERYVEMFVKMVELAFPGEAPAQTSNGLSLIRGKVKDLGELGKQAQFQHGVLSDVWTRAQEGRQRIAEQMTEFTEGTKRLRAALQPLKVASARHREKADAFPAELMECHRELIRWEGRSGFREPYEELAQAYRAMAELVDRWWSVRSAQRACDADAAGQTEQLSELEAQLEEIRKALAVHESNVDSEIEACEQALSKLGAQADELEPDLLDLATRFTAPLRAKPETASCFRELEQVGA